MRRTSSDTPSTSHTVDDDCPVKKERSGTILKTATTKEILNDLVKKRYVLIEDIFYLEFSDIELCLKDTYHMEDLKELAVPIYYMDSKGYDYVRKTYSTVLPPPQDLGNLWMNDKYRPGFTSQAFELLRQKSAVKRPICALVVDDISLFGNSVRLDSSYRIGVEDFGVGNTGEEFDEFARDAYVFTLVSLEENWKIPIAYVMVKNTTYKRRTSLILTCLRESFYAGVDVVALSFDLMNGFKSIAEELGCDFDNPRDLKTTFKHPECDIAVGVFFNTWWLKVMVRNTLECNIVMKEKKKVTWQPIKNLKNLQERGVDYKKKLTKEHLDFKNLLLKLDLTNLTFSYSVAEALMSYTEMIKGSDEDETKATTEYVVVFNKLCDVLASNLHSGKELRKVLSKENSRRIFDVLDESKQYILSLKLKNTPIVDTNRSECYVAFLICIESLKHLYKTLVEKDKLPYIATQKLSNDFTWALIENLLRKGNKEPRAAEFKKLYDVLGINLRANPLVTSCIIAENLPMIKFAEAVANINYTSGRLAYNEIYTNIAAEEEVLKKHRKDKSLDTMKVYVKILNADVTDSVNEIVGLLAGWVVKELLKVVKCEKCLDSLLTNEVKWYHKMIPIRLTICGSCLPSGDVFKICSKAETLTNKFKREVGHLMNNPVSIESLKMAVLQRFVDFDSDLFSSLEGHSKEQTPMYNHRLQLARAVIDKYVDVRTDNVKITKAKKSFMW